jgi:hypothetical protein
MLSGEFTTPINAYLTLRLVWTATQNIEANTSTITATTYLDRALAISSSASKSVSISVGSNSYSGATQVGGSGTMAIQSVSVAVAHSAEGKLTTSVGGSIALNITWSGSYIGTVSVGGSITLNDIARATQPTVSYNPIDVGQTQGINVSSMASPTFSHHAYYSIGSSGQLFAGAGAAGVGLISWSLPASLISYMGTAASALVTINVATLINPGASQTIVGWKTASFTATIPNAAPYVPTINSIDVKDAASLGAFAGAWVQGLSIPKVTTTAAGGSGVSISTYAVSIDAGSQKQNLTGQVVTGVALVNSGTLAVTVTVTDQRGRSVSKTASAITVYPYALPAITRLSAFRASDSSGTPSDTGTYLSVNITTSVSSVNGKNSIDSLTLAYREEGGSWSSGITIPVTSGATSYTGTYTVSASTLVLSPDKRYEVQLTAKDKKPSTVTGTGAIPTAYFAMDLSPDGKQIAFGGAASKQGLEIAMPLIITSAGSSFRIIPLRLRVSAWASKKQVFAVDGLGASTPVRLISSPFSTNAELTAIALAGISGSQAAGVLTITAGAVQPTIDVYMIAKEIL